MRTRAQGLLLGGLAGIAMLLAGCGGGDDDGSGRKKRDGEVYLAKVGLSVIPPKGWGLDREGDALELRSPKRTIFVSVSSPIEGREPARIKRALIEQLRGTLDRARLTDEGEGRLGGRKAVSFALRGRLGGQAVTALGLVDDSPFRTYLVRTLIFDSADGPALQGLRTLLRGVQISKPEGAEEPKKDK